MITSPRRQQWLLMLAVVTPALVVQGVGFIMGSGARPAAVHAAPAIEPQAEAPPAVKAAAPDPEVLRALAFLKKERDAGGQIASPMDHTPEAPPPTAPPPATTFTGPAPSVPPPPMSLTAIIAGGRGSMAVINGSVFRVGDEIAKGWVLTGIDAAKLTAQVSGPQGSSVTIAQPRADGD